MYIDTHDHSFKICIRSKRKEAMVKQPDGPCTPSPHVGVQAPSHWGTIEAVSRPGRTRAVMSLSSPIMMSSKRELKCIRKMNTNEQCKNVFTIKAFTNVWSSYMAFRYLMPGQREIAAAHNLRYRTFVADMCKFDVHHVHAQICGHTAAAAAVEVKNAAVAAVRLAQIRGSLRHPAAVLHVQPMYRTVTLRQCDMCCGTLRQLDRNSTSSAAHQLKLRTSCSTRGCRHGYPRPGIRGLGIRRYEYSFPTDGASTAGHCAQLTCFQRPQSTHNASLKLKWNPPPCVTPLPVHHAQTTHRWFRPRRARIQEGQEALAGREGHRTPRREDLIPEAAVIEKLGTRNSRKKKQDVIELDTEEEEKGEVSDGDDNYLVLRHLNIYLIPFLLDQSHRPPTYVRHPNWTPQLRRTHSNDTRKNSQVTASSLRRLPPSSAFISYTTTVIGTFKFAGCTGSCRLQLKWQYDGKIISSATAPPQRQCAHGIRRRIIVYSILRADLCVETSYARCSACGIMPVAHVLRCARGVCGSTATIPHARGPIIGSVCSPRLKSFHQYKPNIRALELCIRGVHGNSRKSTCSRALVYYFTKRNIGSSMADRPTLYKRTSPFLPQRQRIPIPTVADLPSDNPKRPRSASHSNSDSEESDPPLAPTLADGIQSRKRRKPAAMHFPPNVTAGAAEAARGRPTTRSTPIPLEPARKLRIIATGKTGKGRWETVETSAALGNGGGGPWQRWWRRRWYIRAATMYAAAVLVCLQRRRGLACMTAAASRHLTAVAALVVSVHISYISAYKHWQRGDDSDHGCVQRRFECVQRQRRRGVRSGACCRRACVHGGGSLAAEGYLHLICWTTLPNAGEASDQVVTLRKCTGGHWGL
ncbi:hypothetical protein GGX14DRAFT_545723 [Mycena pura]|uniref:Uncharacterized protein n=1 Tax=Mycena pura TaxID=153505 RepID=A0AAD6V0E3_9AGAR|nr:hypothetical protein GGX14DRAFT_545723 [Mycena pura]